MKERPSLAELFEAKEKLEVEVPRLRGIHEVINQSFSRLQPNILEDYVSGALRKGRANRHVLSRLRAFRDEQEKIDEEILCRLEELLDSVNGIAVLSGENTVPVAVLEKAVELTAGQIELFYLGKQTPNTVDEQRFSEAYALHHDRVFRRFHSTYGINPQDAEDLTQRVFMNVWRTRDRSVPDDRLIAWLLAIAKNEMKDYFYQRPTRSLLGAAELRAGDISDPAMRLEGSEEVDALKSAILGLRQDWRQVLLMHFWGGMSHPEIARALGKTESATKSMVHKALLDLRKSLGVAEVTRPRVSRTVETGPRFTYGDLAEITGISRKLLRSKISRAEKTQRINLSVRRSAVRMNFTKEDARTVLSYLGLDHSLLDQIPVAPRE